MTQGPLTRQAKTEARIARIVQLLRLPHTKAQLANRLGITTSTLEPTLLALRAQGRITAERDGNEIRYRRVPSP